MEFLQMLADPEYLYALNMRGYFFDEKFMEYLKGLAYLLQWEYIKLMRFPEGVWNLKTILGEGFVESTKRPEAFARFLEHCRARNQQIREF